VSALRARLEALRALPYDIALRIREVYPTANVRLEADRIVIVTQEKIDWEKI